MRQESFSATFPEGALYILRSGCIRLREGPASFLLRPPGRRHCGLFAIRKIGLDKLVQRPFLPADGDREGSAREQAYPREGKDLSLWHGCPDCLFSLHSLPLQPVHMDHAQALALRNHRSLRRLKGLRPRSVQSCAEASGQEEKKAAKERVKKLKNRQASRMPAEFCEDKTIEMFLRFRCLDLNTRRVGGRYQLSGGVPSRIYPP